MRLSIPANRKHISVSSSMMRILRGEVDVVIRCGLYGSDELILIALALVIIGSGYACLFIDC
jgi:hypothetical protein